MTSPDDGREGDPAGAAPPRRAGRVPVLLVLLVLVGLVAVALWAALDDGGTGAADRERGGSRPGRSAAAPVDWAQVRYPMDCQGVPVQVVQVRTGNLDADPEGEAVVQVRCAAGAGSPPSALFGYDVAPAPASGGSAGPAGTAGSQQHARLLGRLLSPADDVLVSSLRVADGTVSASGTTYSSPRVPRCCPDVRFDAVWKLGSSGFHRVS